MRKIHILIDFAMGGNHCIDHLRDIQLAVGYASHNLSLRHGVNITKISTTDRGEMILTLEVSEKAVDFNAGMRLKGISQYLLKHFPEIYRPMTIGTRLFTYKVLAE